MILAYKLQTQKGKGLKGGRMKEYAYTVFFLDLPQVCNIELLWKRGLAHPVLSVIMCDLTGDGLDEIIILSTAGVHILQVSS